MLLDLNEMKEKSGRLCLERITNAYAKNTLLLCTMYRSAQVQFIIHLHYPGRHQNVVVAFFMKKETLSPSPHCIPCVVIRQCVKRMGYWYSTVHKCYRVDLPLPR